MYKNLLLIGLLALPASNGWSNSNFMVKVDCGYENENPYFNVDTPKFQQNINIHGNEIIELPFSIKSLIPDGYIPLDTATGDLNLDQYPDFILILKNKQELAISDDSVPSMKRPFLIFIAQSDKAFKLINRNENVIYCARCGGVMGDPFMDVIIHKGSFSIEHYGGSSWRWSRTTTFKYSYRDQTWYLEKDGGDNFHVSDPENVTTKLRTVDDFGKVDFSDFDIYRDE